MNASGGIPPLRLWYSSNTNDIRNCTWMTASEGIPPLKKLMSNPVDLTSRILVIKNILPPPHVVQPVLTAHKNIVCGSCHLIKPFPPPLGQGHLTTGSGRRTFQHGTACGHLPHNKAVGLPSPGSKPQLVFQDEWPASGTLCIKESWTIVRRQHMNGYPSRSTWSAPARGNRGWSQL